MRQIILLILGLVLLPFVSGLLISPAILEVEYEDSLEFNITVINDMSQDIVVQVSFESYEGKIDYTDNFKIRGYETNKIKVSGGSYETLFFDMTMPELEQFGDIRFAIIRFYQVPLTQGDMAATVTVLIPVETSVPYPDTYVKIDLDEPGVVQQGEEILFSALLTHLGQNVINEIEGDFILIGNGVEDEVAIDPIDLFFPSESQTVQASYSTLELGPGKYNLSLSLSYDSESKVSNPVRLIVGEENVEILDFNPKSLNGNSMNTATFTLFSLWVDDLDVELSLDLISNDVVKKSFEFGSYTLPVNQEKVISNGLDLVSVNGGNYIVRVKAKVGEELITKDFEVSVANGVMAAPEKENHWLLYVSIGLILIALILFIVYLVKRNKNEENYLGGSV